MKKLIYIAAIGGLTLLNASCENYEAAEIPEKYHKVLILKEAGEMDLTLYRTGEDSKYELCIMKAGSGDGLTADANLVVSPEWLDKFNTDNASGYTLLPSQYYSLETEHVKIEKNDKYKIVNISFKTTEMETLISGNPDMKYVLPVQLESDNTTISKAKNYLILKPSVVIPTIGFKNGGYQKTVLTPTDPEQIKITIPVEMPLDNTWNFDCTIGINEQLLTDYNQKNGTSYLILPENAYQLKPTCSFVPGNSSANINLTVDRTKLGMGDYILPLELQSCTQEGFAIDDSKKAYLTGISYAPPKITLALNMLSSNATVSGDGTGLLGLIDGLGSGKHYHSDYGGNYHDPVYGHYIDVNLPTAIQSIMFDFYTRWENGNGAPQTVNLYIRNNDSENWTKLATVDRGMPTAGNTEYMSNIFRSETPFKQVRFSVVKSVAGDLTAPGYSYFNLGELSLYGQ